jgi:hypothetical protein
VSIKTQLEALIRGVRDALGGHDQARLEEYMGAAYLKAVIQEGGATGSENLYIG